MEIGEEQDVLMGKIKVLQLSFNEESTKSEKGAKNTHVLQKDLKSAKLEIKSEDNSTYLHSDSFEIKTGKSQGN